MKEKSERINSGEAIGIHDSQHWLDHLLYHMVRYKFASKILPRGNIIDYGCGTGYGTQFLHSAGFDVEGIDNQEGMIHTCNTHFPHAIFNYANWLSAGYSGCKLDGITCFETVEHMPLESAKRLLGIFRDSLREGGMLVTSTPKYKEFDDRSYARQKYHVHEYTYDRFKGLLSDSFKRSMVLTQTDEIITAGNADTCWTYIGICYA